MKPQPQRGHNADANTDAVAAGFLRLGVKENREEVHEAEPARLSLPRERGEEPKAQSEPEQGAALEGKEAGYEEGEEKEGGDVGAGAAGPPDGESREANAEVEAEAGAGGGQGGERGGEEQRPGAAIQVWKAADRRHRVSRHTFTLEQLRELEGVFHRTPYLSMAMRQELARHMGVTEDRMQGLVLKNFSLMVHGPWSMALSRGLVLICVNITCGNLKYLPIYLDGNDYLVPPGTETEYLFLEQNVV